MGYATPYEVFVYPLVRDGSIFFPVVLWWVAFNIAMEYLVPRLLPNFHRITNRASREDIVVRFVSAANGMIMSTAMPIFVRYALQHGLSPSLGLYVEIPEYRVYRVAVSAYFMWDVIVCFYYQWSLAWKIHAICSLTGSFFLLYPLADNIGSYYCGWFEGTNAFMHFSVILRALSTVCQPEKYPKEKLRKERMDRIATVLEYCFAVSYFFVRVIGGSVTTYVFCVAAYQALAHDWHSGTAPKVHNEVVLLFSSLSVCMIQMLQYVWFIAIVKKGLGYEVDDTAHSTEEQEAAEHKKK